MDCFSKLFIIGNGTQWCDYSLQSFKESKNTVVINNNPILIPNKFLWLQKIQFASQLNRRFYVPLKSIWYKKILEYIGYDENEDKNACFLMYDRNALSLDYKFIKYLKKNNPSIKLAYIFTNIVKYSAAGEFRYIDKLNALYDAVFAFDKEDAKKNNFSYSPLIYDPLIIPDNKESENEAFYVGKAKDRADTLLDIYEKLRSLNIKCDFNIVGVSEENMRFQNEISYNRPIPYETVVEHIKNSTCLIDVIQGDSTGLTIKTCEAVCYDKKLITTNKHAKEYPFYDPRFIRIVESPEDIDLAFFTENRDVHYSDEGKKYFSADTFLERLETELKRKRG